MNKIAIGQATRRLERYLSPLRSTDSLIEVDMEEFPSVRLLGFDLSDAKDIGDYVSAFGRLHTLSMRRCNIGTTSQLDFIAKMDSLKVLVLADNDVADLPPDLPVSLTELDVSGNRRLSHVICPPVLAELDISSTKVMNLNNMPSTLSLIWADHLVRLDEGEWLRQTDYDLSGSRVCSYFERCRRFDSGKI